MKEYLKMSDVFPGGVYVGTEEWMNGWFEVRHVGGSSIDESCDGGYSERDANYVSHAINSHDELVAMNKELLAALELMLLIHDEPSGFCGKFGKELDMAIEDQKEKIDTRIAVAINAIAKAKVA